MNRRTFVLPARIALVALSLGASLAHAEGFERVTTTAANIEATLTGLAIVTVTIAILIAGYLLLFRAAQWSLVAWIIGGAVLIGGAAQIAAFLVGS